MAAPRTSTLDTIADVRFHRLLFHPLSLFLMAVAAMITVSIVLWHQHRDTIVDRTAWQLTPERIETNPQPDWIQTDIKQTAFDGSRLGDLSLIDPDAVTRVADAFRVQPWVANVSIRKSPDQMIVDVQYRQPVALVEYGDRLLLPVDAQGIVLDGSEFNPESAIRFLRISVHSPLIGSLVSGEPWPDNRVVAAALIAARIHRRADDWGILRIKHLPLTPDSLEPAGDFELLTNDGSDGPRVIWGNPPGFELPAELSAAEKVATLDALVAEHGSLRDWPRPQTIDLRFQSTQLINRH